MANETNSIHWQFTGDSSDLAAAAKKADDAIGRVAIEAGRARRAMANLDVTAAKTERSLGGGLTRSAQAVGGRFGEMGEKISAATEGMAQLGGPAGIAVALAATLAAGALVTARAAAAYGALALEVRDNADEMIESGLITQEQADRFEAAAIEADALNEAFRKLTLQVADGFGPVLTDVISSTSDLLVIIGALTAEGPGGVPSLTSAVLRGATGWDTFAASVGGAASTLGFLADGLGVTVDEAEELDPALAALIAKIGSLTEAEDKASEASRKLSLSRLEGFAQIGEAERQRLAAIDSEIERLTALEEQVRHGSEEGIAASRLITAAERERTLVVEDAEREREKLRQEIAEATAREDERKAKEAEKERNRILDVQEANTEAFHQGMRELQEQENAELQSIAKIGEANEKASADRQAQIELEKAQQIDALNETFAALAFSLSAAKGLQEAAAKDNLALAQALGFAQIAISTAEGIMKAISLGPIAGPIYGAGVLLAAATQGLAVANASLGAGGGAPSAGGAGFSGGIDGATGGGGEPEFAGDFGGGGTFIFQLNNTVFDAQVSDALNRDSTLDAAVGSRGGQRNR